MKQSFLLLSGIIFLSNFVFAQDNFKYQQALSDAAIKAKEKKCWTLQHSPGLSSVEFARVRAFCWARQNPSIVNSNPIYRSQVLKGVTEQTADERLEAAERQIAQSRNQWQIEEQRLQLNCRGENTSWISNTIPATGNLSKQPHGSCQCQEGFEIVSDTPRLSCQRETEIELIAVADHRRDESSDVDDFVQRYWNDRSSGNNQ